MSVDQNKMDSNNEISDKELDGVVGGSIFSKIKGDIQSAVSTVESTGQHVGSEIASGAQGLVSTVGTGFQGLPHGFPPLPVMPPLPHGLPPLPVMPPLPHGVPTPSGIVGTVEQQGQSIIGSVERGVSSLLHKL